VGLGARRRDPGWRLMPLDPKEVLAAVVGPSSLGSV
jgi:hypothetical protein